MTLEEIIEDYFKKDPYARDNGLYSNDWKKIARLYAEAKCKEQRAICANLATIDFMEVSDAPAPKFD